MTPPGPSPSSAPLSVEALRVLDGLCDAFERACREGILPELEDMVAQADERLRPRLREELFRIQLEWSCRRGEEISLECSQRRFPEYSEALPQWLAEAERAADQAEALRHSSMAPPSLAPKTLTLPFPLGEYDLVRLLGAGGMGEVYEGHHRRLKKRVAVKLLPMNQSPNRRAKARFAREMAALGPLAHPHLAQAHDAGERDGRAYLVMEYVDGVDLERYVERYGPLPATEACALVRQAALGLEYLHKRGWVHRDIKPANLMRTPEAVVKVLDLGLAEGGDAATNSGRRTSSPQGLGTPDYLAPEQVCEDAVTDGRTDLYGLGGTLFYLLTGRSPFAHHKGISDKIHAALFEPPPDVRSLQVDVPARVAALVHRLLSKRPEGRPATARCLIDELDRLCCVTTSLRDPEYRQSRSVLRERAVGMAVGVLVAWLTHVLVGEWREAPISRAIPKSAEATADLYPNISGIFEASPAPQVAGGVRLPSVREWEEAAGSPLWLQKDTETHRRTPSPASSMVTLAGRPLSNPSPEPWPLLANGQEWVGAEGPFVGSLQQRQF